MPLVELDCFVSGLIHTVFAYGGDRSEMPPNADEGENQVSSPRKSLEQEYLDYETKVRFALLIFFIALPSD